jgi:hypothetical protein
LFRMYLLLILVVFLAGVAGCGDQGAKAQQAVKLYTTAANSGGGGMSCFALNTGEDTLPEIKLRLVQAEGSSVFQKSCDDVKAEESCIFSIVSDVPRYCIIEVMGDENNAVRGSLIVQDSAGATILSLEAR